MLLTVGVSQTINQTNIRYQILNRLYPSRTLFAYVKCNEELINTPVCLDIYGNQMKKDTIVGTVPQSSKKKIVARGQIYNKHIHSRSLSWLHIDTLLNK